MISEGDFFLCRNVIKKSQSKANDSFTSEFSLILKKINEIKAKNKINKIFSDVKNHSNLGKVQGNFGFLRIIILKKKSW